MYAALFIAGLVVGALVMFVVFVCVAGRAEAPPVDPGPLGEDAPAADRFRPDPHVYTGDGWLVMRRENLYTMHITRDGFPIVGCGVLSVNAEDCDPEDPGALVRVRTEDGDEFSTYSWNLYGTREAAEADRAAGIVGDAELRAIARGDICAGGAGGGSPPARATGALMVEGVPVRRGMHGLVCEGCGETVCDVTARWAGIAIGSPSDKCAVCQPWRQRINAIHMANMYKAVRVDGTVVQS
ncbi:MAG: hypothetical protein ACREJO_03510 [Phycisphaerales bacterium]